MGKFGFQPELLATLLGLYRRAVSTIFGDRNDKEYLFFHFGSSGAVEPLKADGLGKRIGRRLKALTGKGPRSQMFRTMFCTWLNNEADPGPTAADRDFMSKHMMHDVSRQLCDYRTWA
eukprot:COSAG02_NODE_18774_length_920_cov_0.942753_1_plen_118_part_00